MSRRGTLDGAFLTMSTRGALVRWSLGRGSYRGCESDGDVSMVFFWVCRTSRRRRLILLNWFIEGFADFEANSAALINSNYCFQNPVTVV